jgi:hypothetical protein
MKTTNILAVILVLVIIGMAYCMSTNESEKPMVAMSRKNYEIQNRTIDSLTNVIDSLETEIFVIEDGCDYREHRMEDALFEYELGLSYLKDYHPKAYKDFHRIIGMKERYSAEVERENTKILNQFKNK